MSSRKSTLITITLLAAIVAIFGISMWLNRGASEDSSFVGTDTAATEHIEANHPEYTPWFTSVFTPGSGEIESGLFALQAAIGGGVFGFAIGALWQRNRKKSEAALPRNDPVSGATDG
ncbi:energy-coupling factor ABC transporter substrate-binding protein [Gordonia sp. ABSL11-1]|uniref:energy-coupling factor ABC transporter substrate-binding protein n=1 Tax=Gordonia sp. ABSL11-1 TaxID=3053924 RepID=UPI0025732BB8|nr:energy-coupling factor ABC transporter substrate-binding protein [Gordonia sp. ABSL11-1]MDL9948485.1 energy-coupling factor ABC transporter substrate-binding protein [Gordonia sp. ABSL11-1]